MKPTPVFRSEWELLVDQRERLVKALRDCVLFIRRHHQHFEQMPDCLCDPHKAMALLAEVDRG